MWLALLSAALYTYRLLTLPAICTCPTCSQDPLKREAPAVVAALRRMGLQCHMLTGDNWTTARSIAARVGIDRVSAEVAPADKARQVQQLQVGACGLFREWVGKGRGVAVPSAVPARHRLKELAFLMCDRDWLAPWAS